MQEQYKNLRIFLKDDNHYIGEVTYDKEGKTPTAVTLFDVPLGWNKEILSDALNSLLSDVDNYDDEVLDYANVINKKRDFTLNGIEGELKIQYEEKFNPPLNDGKVDIYARVKTKILTPKEFKRILKDDLEKYID